MGSAGYYEPSLMVRHLPRCAACSVTHPLALTPPVESPTCLECGTALPNPPNGETVSATLTGRGPLVFVARALLAAGKACAKLRRKLTP